MLEGTALAVHRCRFVAFSPSAITALAFPPLRLPSVKGKKSVAFFAFLFLSLLFLIC